MQIPKQQAYHIANYLYKGVFEENYPALNIQIGENADIGISRVGKKTVLYVQYMGKTDKLAKEKSFNKEINIEELSEMVVNIVAMSSMLKDVTFDMSRTPIIPTATTVQPVHQEQPQTSIPVADSIDADSIIDNMDSTSSIEKHKAYEHEANELNNDVSITELPNNDNRSEEKSFLEEPISDELEPEESTKKINYERKDNLSMDNTKILQEQSPIKSNNAPLPLRLTNTSDEKLAGRFRFSISEQSYLFRTLGSDEEIKEKMAHVASAIVDFDKECAIEHYISLISTLFLLYDKDIAKMASDLQIDERDILLAVYEKTNS